MCDACTQFPPAPPVIIYHECSAISVRRSSDYRCASIKLPTQSVLSSRLAPHEKTHYVNHLLVVVCLKPAAAAGKLSPRQQHAGAQHQTVRNAMSLDTPLAVSRLSCVSVCVTV